MLWEAGYQSPDGTHLTDYQARRAGADTPVASVRWSGIMWTYSERPTPDGAKFARAALLAWPK